MKKNKKRHGKKSSSFRRKKARRRTSSSLSSEATSCIVLSSSKQYNRRSSTVSSVSSPSNSRSSSIRKKSIQSDFSEEKLRSIAFYIDNREEMVRHMFASLRRRELYELLPENLKKLEIAKLRYLCVKELNGMSKKNICTILKGKDFGESSESEEEKNETFIINNSVKKSKAEIAVADSTTETAPNLSDIFRAVDISDAVSCNNITNAFEVDSIAVENISSIKTNQESENVAAIITPENDDELEDGEVVSDEEKSSNSNKNAALNKDQNCSQHLTIHRDLFTVSVQADSSPASMPKNSGYSGNSTDTTNKVREEKRLHMLELELRARAIEALIKRSDNKL